MNELQTGVEFALAVFPETTAFLDPCERAFNHPALRHDGKGVQLAAFGDLNLGTEQFLNGQCKWLADIATIGQDALNRLQVSSTAAQSQQGSFAVCYISRCDGNRMGQSLGVDRDMAFDPRNFLAGVVALLLGTIGVLDALRVDDQEARRGFAPLFCTSLANRIFLKPAPGR